MDSPVGNYCGQGKGVLYGRALNARLYNETSRGYRRITA